MWIVCQDETGCVLGTFCGTSHRQQLSQHKNSFSGMLVLPAGLSLGSFDKQLPKTKWKRRSAKKIYFSYQKTFMVELIALCRKQTTTVRVSLLLPLGIVIYFLKWYKKKLPQWQAYLIVCLMISQTDEKKEKKKKNLKSQAIFWQINRALTLMRQNELTTRYNIFPGPPHCSYLSTTVTLTLSGMSSEIVKALIKD